MKVLFWDNGLCTEIAISFARAGHSVTYCTPWAEAFPSPAKAFIGRGLEGITVADSFTKALPNAEIVVCPDTFSIDRVEQSKKAGKPTWGAGDAERLEQNRPFMKKTQQALGLPTGKYEEITGVDNLIKYLQDPKSFGKFVKTSKWRLLETFQHMDWESTRNHYLGLLLSTYGPSGDSMVFVVEDKIEGVEIGEDRLFANGNWLEPSGYGYERKDEAYFGTHTPELPKALKLVNDALVKPLGDCRSFVSTEVRVTDQKVGYMIEPTVRAPHPPLAGMLEMYSNIPEVIIQAAQGKNIPLKPLYRYCAVLVIHSDLAKDSWCEVHIEQRYRPFIKLSQACRINGKYYAVAGNTFVGYTVGVGPSLETAANMAKRVAESIKGSHIGFDETALDKLMNETIPAGRKVGIEF